MLCRLRAPFCLRRRRRRRRRGVYDRVYLQVSCRIRTVVRLHLFALRVQVPFLPVVAPSAAQPPRNAIFLGFNSLQTLGGGPLHLPPFTLGWNHSSVSFSTRKSRGNKIGIDKRNQKLSSFFCCFPLHGKSGSFHAKKYVRPVQFKSVKP